MDFVALVDQVIALLRQRGRVTYRTLQRQFQLDADALADLLGELRYAHQEALREDEQGLIWTDEARPTPPAPARPAAPGAQAPLTYTPAYLAEQILTSRSALEGERKQVTVLFADIKDSTELIRDLDPEAAQQLLDPALHAMMAAVHRYEGTVNQVLGDGIMALFGAPLAHEDHALRACYAALTMQTAMREYTETVRRAHGIEMRIRVGLNSGEVVVRAIGNDLHMDYSAVGQTTHLAARMEQLATPGTIRLTAATLRLVEGLVQVQALGPIPVYCTVLADVCDHLGHTEDGLQALAEAHALVEQHEERWWEAEVCRLRGVLLLRQPGTSQAEAEAWLQRALDVARRQEAKVARAAGCHEPQSPLAAAG